MATEKGRYVNLVKDEEKGTLTLVLTEDGKEELKDMREKMVKGDYSDNETIIGLMEDHLGNGWTATDPDTSYLKGEFHALTDIQPWLSDDFEYYNEEDEELMEGTEDDSKHYYSAYIYPLYALHLYIDILERDGQIVFEKQTFEGNYGVFTYLRNNPEGGAFEAVHVHSKDVALRFANRRIKGIDKGVYWVEVWEKDDGGLWGNSGEPLLTTH
jgi:hypothetical protein